MSVRGKAIGLSVALSLLCAANSFLVFFALRQTHYRHQLLALNARQVQEYVTVKALVLRALKESNDAREAETRGDDEQVRGDEDTYFATRKLATTSLATIDASATEERELAAHPPFPTLLYAVDAADAPSPQKRRAAGRSVEHLFQQLDRLVGLDRSAFLFAGRGLAIAAESEFDQFVADAIDGAVAEERQEIARQGRDIDLFQRRALLVLGALTALTLALLGWFIAWTSRSLIHRIGSIATVMEAFRGGDAVARATVWQADEVDRVASAFNALAAELILKQEALVASSKMSALGEMAGGIAHEINNPLAVITARASQIRRLVQRGQPDGPMLERFSSEIEATAMRIAKIIVGLRSFARNGDQDPFAAAAVDELLADVLTLCVERFKTKGIPLELTNDAPGAELDCRATQVVQVLVNLLNNALDAVEPLAVRWVRVHAAQTAEGVEIAVTDSGAGVPEPVRARLFQPFFTTKPVGKGTGIGLSIAHGIIAAHGGALSLDVACRNTRFVVRLPKKQAAGAKRAA
jgi:signal transduction histidine kinase